MKTLKLINCTDFDGKEIVFPDGRKLSSKLFFMQHIGAAKAIGEQAVALWALGLKINAIADGQMAIALEDAELDLLAKTCRNSDSTMYVALVHAQIEETFSSAKKPDISKVN